MTETLISISLVSIFKCSLVQMKLPEISHRYCYSFKTSACILR